MTADSNSPEFRLFRNERMLWMGRPRQGVWLRLNDWYLIPFSIMWAAFAVYWTVTVMQDPWSPLAFILMGLFMTGCGAYMVIGRFVVDILRRRATRYALTSMRAIISCSFPYQLERSLDLSTLSDIQFNETFGGKGSIVLSTGENSYIMYLLLGGSTNWPFAAMLAPPQFEMINDARTVYELVSAARGELEKRAGNRKEASDGTEKHSDEET